MELITARNDDTFFIFWDKEDRYDGIIVFLDKKEFVEAKNYSHEELEKYVINQSTYVNKEEIL